MTDTDSYNGWANRETWLVALWINNEQGWQEQVHDALREAVGEVVVGASGYEHADVPLTDWQAGDIVRENVEQNVAWSLTGDPDGDIPGSLVSDLLGTALAAVDWSEIGATFLTSLAEVSA